MKKILAMLMGVTMIGTTIVGCTEKIEVVPDKMKEHIAATEKVNNLKFDFEVNPVNFEISVISNGVKETLSRPLEDRKISQYEATEGRVSWTYPEEEIEVVVEKVDNYLEVKIKTNKKEDTSFSWPVVSGESYALPWHEGKIIPSDDANWKEFLNEAQYNVIEAFSMQFFAVNKEKYSVTYIIENKFSNTINFNTEDEVEFTFNHDFTRIDDNKEYGFKIYLTEKNISDIAKTYKNYIMSKGEFKTLEEKATQNPNIRKLYGAPHIYFWEKAVIDKESINWQKIKGNIPDVLVTWVKKLLVENVEDSQEMINVFEDIKGQDYIDDYQKKQIVRAFNEALTLREFYNSSIFKDIDSQMVEEAKNINQMTRVEYITFNKKLLKSILGELVTPIDEWCKDGTVEILAEMREAGITNAWIGLDDIAIGFIAPNFVKTANEYGYLIGPYDSYHSIHKPGEERWSTATFKDTTLYEGATVLNKDGEKETGFQGEGRKLNPTLSMPSVKARVEEILNEGYDFNSWFIDVDATGEIHEDYTKEHITTFEEDLKARLERMGYIRDTAHAVIGSEGGNDFASTTIAFSHGLETPAFSWVDRDMNKNKESEYYVGRYYSPDGGVPEVFSKQVPLKDLYREIFVSPKYSVPLFKLVYNDSVISSYQWLWGTFKMKDDVETRMMKEILYNTAPMYHLDRTEWDKHKEAIIKHNAIWSPFNKKAILEPMTNFEFLSDDQLIQKTQFGETLEVIANFTDKGYSYQGENIEAKSLIIKDEETLIKYKP